jgi:hypothetical protein
MARMTKADALRIWHDAGAAISQAHPDADVVEHCRLFRERLAGDPQLQQAMSRLREQPQPRATPARPTSDLARRTANYLARARRVLKSAPQRIPIQPSERRIKIPSPNVDAVRLHEQAMRQLIGDAEVTRILAADQILRESERS